MILKFKKVFQIFILCKCISKYLKNKANILNYLFCHFEFFVCFAQFLHEVERNIILDIGLIGRQREIEARKWGHTETPHLVV